jgi:hypothetical protein
MKKAIGTLLAAAAIAVTAPATANANGYGYVTYPAHVYYPHHALAGLRDINMRQAEQRARIERGFHRGAITRHEFHNLMSEQNHIQAIERSYVADGFLSPSERHDLNRRLDFAGRHIRWEASDGQRRF